MADKKPIAIPYQTLVGLLGKQPTDPAVAKVIAKAGKVSVNKDFIVAKDAGFDFSVGQPENAKRNDPRVLQTLFLFDEGVDKHRGYRDLPAGFRWGTRAELLAGVPAPRQSWKLGKGKVPVHSSDVLHDTWTIDGLDVCVSYRGGTAIRHYNISLPDEATGGRDFSTHPLHFATRPVDAPPGAELVGMALLVAWAADRFGLPAKHAGSPLGKRAISPRTFLVQACGSRLSSLDLAPELGDFVHEYLHHVVDDDGARAAADKQIARLLGLADPERRSYNDDYLATFAGVLDSPFHVPDSWAAVDRIAPVIDARLADFQATGFASAPDVALYEKAAVLRDKVAIEPERAGVAAPKADDALADDLVALIGKSLKDPEVKAVLARAGLPVGKRIDQQANPALGVAYMGAKLEIAGKPQLGVDAVWFYAAKQRSYIRGIGATVEFAGFPGKLPRGLVLGEPRAAVANKLGKPSSTYEATDSWRSKGIQLSCGFAGGKLVELRIGRKD